MATAHVPGPSPDPRALGEKLDKILAVLLHGRAGEPWMTASAISQALLNNHGITIHWRSVQNVLLNATGGIVARRKRKRRWEFAIMKPGEDRLLATSAITLIDPEQAVTAVASLHGFLSGLTGPVRICDPYLDTATIEHLDAAPRDVEIRLLTQNVRDDGALRRLVAATKVQGHNLRIRVVAGRVLHDRYIIDDKDMLILGTSLNGFGKKQSFVIRAGPDTRAAMIVTFDQLWDTANPWP